MHNNSSSKLNQEEDEYYIMREIEIKRKQIDNKHKELLLLRKKQFDNFNINKSIQTAIDSYITSLRSNEKYLIKQQFEINKREQRLQKKEYVLNKVLQLNTNNEDIYNQRKEYLKRTIESIKQNNLKITGGGIVLMNNKTKNTKMKMKKKKISNLIIDKAANITIKKQTQRAKTVNIQKRNKKNEECQYENISNSYLRTLMIKGNKKNKDLKQTIQSSSSIGNVTRNSTITHHSIEAKNKINKSFKKIENLILEYDNYCKKTNQTNANNNTKPLVSSQSMNNIISKKQIKNESTEGKSRVNVIPVNTSRNKSINKEKIPKPITPIKNNVKKPKPIQTIKPVNKEKKTNSKSQIKSNKWKEYYQKEKEELLKVRAKTLENIKKEKEKEILNTADNSIIIKESITEKIKQPLKENKKVQTVNVPINNNIIPLKSKRKKKIIDSNERNKSTTPRKGKVIRLYTPSPVKESPILIKGELNNKSSLYSDNSNLLSEYEQLKEIRRKEEEKSTNSLNNFISPVSQSISKFDSMIKSPVSQFSIITTYNYHNIDILFNQLKEILMFHSKKSIIDTLSYHLSQYKLYHLFEKYKIRNIIVNPIAHSFYIMMKNISSNENESYSICSEVDFETELNKMKEITKETQNIEKDLIIFSNIIKEENF